MNVKKCSFIKELMYLGFVVSIEGLKMDLEKGKAILEWPTLRTTTEVRSFHGESSLETSVVFMHP